MMDRNRHSPVSVCRDGKDGLPIASKCKTDKTENAMALLGQVKPSTEME
jgi:hypothetical protein